MCQDYSPLAKIRVLNIPPEHTHINCQQRGSQVSCSVLPTDE